MMNLFTKHKDKTSDMNCAECSIHEGMGCCICEGSGGAAAI